ncbi:MAG: hypothetical protein HXS48_23410 [Theionarchaea archaeon]|nr:hypothetical protein [Theionarchaea archaeon]
MSSDSISMELIGSEEEAILNLVLKPLVEAYNIVKEGRDMVIKNENSITNDLVKCLKNETSISFLYQNRVIYIAMRPEEHDTTGGVYEPDIKFVVHDIVWVEIEAKRIYKENDWSISKYFDKSDGIGRFLYKYSQNEDYGGMIAYIQNGNFQGIIERIRFKLLESSYKECEAVDGIENSSLSFHHRTNRNDIKIYHLFFYFS